MNLTLILPLTKCESIFWWRASVIAKKFYNIGPSYHDFARSSCVFRVATPDAAAPWSRSRRKGSLTRRRGSEVAISFRPQPRRIWQHSASSAPPDFATFCADPIPEPVWRSPCGSRSGVSVCSRFRHRRRSSRRRTVRTLCRVSRPFVTAPVRRKWHLSRGRASSRIAATVRYEKPYF